MSRLIDADALMQHIPNEEMIAKMAVAHAPSIDIVRCEECKHKEKCTMVAHHLTVGKGIKFVPITYCSAGERQTEKMVCG